MVFVAIGSNLPDSAHRTPLDVCRWAVQQLAELPHMRLLALSCWYRTAPIPAADQPDYINGVAALSGDCEPDAMLQALHAIEHRAGRARTRPNAARPLDLDLLALGAQVSAGPALILPHPRLHERAFVLDPLAEIAPGWRHPLLGKTVAQMQAELTAERPLQRIERLQTQEDDLIWRQRLSLPSPAAGRGQG